LALAPHWDAALGAYPGLHVNFGHFGGVGTGAFDFLKRLTRGAGSSGGGAFVDASYFNELLDNEPKLKAVMTELLAKDASAARVLRKRFLYGSDWKMLMLEEHSENYLARFEALIEGLPSIDPTPAEGARLADSFFGQNAAEFLGLRRGEPCRRRLDDFYRRRGVRGSPVWMPKVDGIV
jgi:hypothetical protein